MNDPVRVIDRCQKTYEEIMKKKNHEMCIWNEQEFEKFIVFVPVGAYRELFITLYYTGLRIGEALALSWDNFTGHSLKIEKSFRECFRLFL